MNNRGRGWFHDRLLTGVVATHWDSETSKRPYPGAALSAEGSSCRPARGSAGHGLCVMGDLPGHPVLRAHGWAGGTERLVCFLEGSRQRLFSLMFLMKYQH